MTPANLKAISFVEQHAEQRKEAAEKLIAHFSSMSNFSNETYQSALEKIEQASRVAVHFHPDRISENGKTVMESLLDSGVYENQFVTKCSNGRLDPERGGSRDDWENQLFGNAYKGPEIEPNERPKYGALDLMGHNCGPAPRFGSCYLLLYPEVKNKCTFTYMDSHNLPDVRGTMKSFDGIMSALLAECFQRSSALGESPLRPDSCLEFLCHAMQKQCNERKDIHPVKNLDHYIEAQIHTPIFLANDVQKICMDPCFSETEVFPLLEEITEEYNIELFWQKGNCLDLEEVPDNFRGPEMPALAKRVASSQLLNAADIGKACQSLSKEPSTWSEFGSQSEVLQKLKMLWHVLLKFGIPFPINSMIPSSKGNG